MCAHISDIGIVAFYYSKTYLSSEGIYTIETYTEYNHLLGRLDMKTKKRMVKKYNRDIETLTTIATSKRKTGCVGVTAYEVSILLDQPTANVQRSFKWLERYGFIKLIKHENKKGHLEKKFYNITFLGVLVLFSNSPCLLKKRTYAQNRRFIEEGAKTSKLEYHYAPAMLKTALEMDEETEDKEYTHTLVMSQFLFQSKMMDMAFTTSNMSNILFITTLLNHLMDFPVLTKIYNRGGFRERLVKNLRDMADELERSPD